MDDDDDSDVVVLLGTSSSSGSGRSGSGSNGSGSGRVKAKEERKRTREEDPSSLAGLQAVLDMTGDDEEEDEDEEEQREREREKARKGKKGKEKKKQKKQKEVEMQEEQEQSDQQHEQNEQNGRGRGKTETRKKKKKQDPEVEAAPAVVSEEEEEEEEEEENGGLVKVEERTIPQKMKEIAPEKPDIGTRMFGNWKDLGTWHSGAICGIQDADFDLYDIEYDDGNVEKKVHRSRILLDNSVLKVDQKIKCNWLNRGIYYKGRILKVNDNETFDVAFDDGDVELSVPRKRIKSIKFGIGERVVSNFLNQGVWYPARVESVRGHLYDLVYDDGDKEKNVSSENVCKNVLHLNIGEVVWADWRGLGAYYRGKVCVVEPRGKFTILYDDMDLENGVPRRLIRSEQYVSLQVGQPVLGNFLNGGIFYKGVITKTSRSKEMEYDIRYEDGDIETKIGMERIIPLEDGGPLKDGQPVFANWKCLGHFHKGKILRVFAGDSYDIEYKDGDTEEGVPRHQIDALEFEPNSTSTTTTTSSSKKNNDN